MIQSAFPVFQRVIAKTIGFDLVEVKPMPAPTGFLHYTDFVYGKDPLWFFDIPGKILPIPAWANRFDPDLTSARELAELNLLPWPIAFADDKGAYVEFPEGRWISWTFEDGILISCSNCHGYTATTNTSCHDGILATVDGVRVTPKYRYGIDTITELMPDLKIKAREKVEPHELLV